MKMMCFCYIRWDPFAGERGPSCFGGSKPMSSPLFPTLQAPNSDAFSRGEISDGWLVLEKLGQLEGESSFHGLPLSLNLLLF